MTVLLNDFNDFSSDVFPYLTYYKSIQSLRKGVNFRESKDKIAAPAQIL